MYFDLYTNHFLNIRCSRATFLAFATYTVAALEKTTNPVLKALAAALRARVAELGGSVVTRQQQAGTGQGLTRTRREVMTLMRTFVRNLNSDVLVPKFRTRPAVLDALLPDGLMGFTEATNDELPVRFEALTKLLETPERVTDLTDQPGKDARKLYDELTEATRLKNEGTKQKRETIGTLGGQWTALCLALWEVHCKALGEYWQEPDQARAYFDYALIPKRNPQRQAADSGTTPAPGN